MKSFPWIAPRRLSLYWHIPFCEYACHYCNFYFETGWSLRVIQETLEASLRQFQRDYHLLGRPPLDTLYLGGGTPSVIPPDLLLRFLMRLGDLADLRTLREATFEANPESFHQEKLAILDETFFTRLSLGVQSFSDRLLHLVGRRSSAKVAFATLELIKKHWKGSWSLDLITGFPTQSFEELMHDLQEALQWHPPHLALYDLTLEEKTPLEKMVLSGAISVLNESQKEDYWLFARQFWCDHGYLDYEISNLALPGFQSIHNQHYWDLDPYLGVGPGAVSLIALEGDKGPQMARLTQAGLFSYRRQEGRQQELLDAKDFLFEHFMVGLRTRKGVLWETLVHRFNKVDGLSLFLAPLLETWRQKNDLSESSPALSLSTVGRHRLHPLLLELSDELDRFPEDVSLRNIS